jgi:Na+/melibiose symporter-like transporter
LDPVLWAIRVLTGPVCVFLLLSVIVVAWIYPLDRRRYERVQRLLRRKQDIKREKAPSVS